MQWQGREGSSNIEDRRGSGGGGGLGGGFPGGGLSGGGMPIPIGGRGGFGGIVGIVVLLGICWALGINPLSLLTGSDGASFSDGSGYTQSAPASADQQQLVDFVGVVVKDTENYWGDYFQQHGATYMPPKVVLFSGSTPSGCGTAQTASGPFYCPNDHQVYLDLAFYQQLQQQFHASGDFAQAYVIAHEVGHHVQNLMGTLPKYQQMMESTDQTKANAISVRIELQADCYAGIWANYAGQENLVESGDFEEALNAADQIGDDTLQKKMQGFAVPKTFNHGTSAQRQTWFARGYKSGDINQCDTFSGNV
jgi:predicted metalloprotease